ncbi:Nucleotide-binding universal stress protein, UspA family [Formosa sp. Hel1_31_208]|uniref:universal stress protein n=1 Tax=Formosa sp. Hel1_31_208 TaxID=1798225 RepID=UPI00087DB8BF|nr:universal stress protein [Formosa sp. Hel1_31_208]SDS67152.1 Nucleotide-binding universal stress protein, UspA family [Formosa sp. Hel1_31_208]
MKKIIVPIDFSEYSEYALETAAILAKRNNAELLVLHMLEIDKGRVTDSNNELNEKMVFFLKLAERKFDEFLSKDYLEGVDVTPIVKHFKVFSEVAEVADEHAADMIVMGSHGSSGLSEIFVGSNTEKVVRHSELPVLVVKQKPTKLEFNTVAFASDFSKEMVEPYLKARQLFDNLKLIHVNVPGEGFRSSSEIDATVADFLKTANGNLDKINDIHYIADYSIEKGILNAANLIGADLIAVPTHGRKGLAHFFAGSVSEDVANHSTLPVITFKI